jgi:threonine dehydrogenase-like Zn-dependent dehydrogenase
MLEKKEFPFPDLVTEVFPFDETQQAFEYWNEAPGKVTKILIDMRTV